MANTQSQRNLAITTSDHKNFSCSWELGDTYGDGQQFQYTIDGGKSWKSVGIYSNQTWVKVSVSTPFSFSRLTFRVRGKRSSEWVSDKWTTYDWSSWVSTSIDYRTSNTGSPTNLSITTSNNRTYTCSWNAGDTNISNQEFQYALDDATTWKSITVSKNQTSASFTITEYNVQNNSKVNFRVRAKRYNGWDSSASNPTYVTYNWSSWANTSFTIPKSSSPSNLEISRDNMRFKCTWEINTPTGYYGGGQELEYRLNGSGYWTPVTISGSKTNVYINVTVPKDLQPLRQFSFRVRGKRAPSSTIVYEWSPWAVKSMTVPLDSNLTTKTPTGLSITRNNLSFICDWKIAAGDHDAGQQFQYVINNRKTWTTVAVGVEQTSKKINLTAADFYPNTSTGLIAFSFRVRGKQAVETDHDGKRTTYDWSAWKSYTLSLYRPLVPSLDAELSSEYDKTTTFTWNVTTDPSDARPFTRVQYQSILVKNSDVTDGSKLSWSTNNSGWLTGTGNADYSRTITEDSSLFATALGSGDVYGPSYTRWFRVRSQGPYGASDWRYGKHVYALPYRGLIKSASTIAANNVTTISMRWEVSQPASRPIDKTEAQYVIAKPESNMQCPDGASWTTASTVRDTSGIDGAVFRIEQVLDSTNNLDSCLWVRIKNTHDHDDNWSVSSPYLAKVGVMSPPAFETLVAHSETSIIEIQVDYDFSVPDWRVAVVCKYGDDKEYVCGILSNTSLTNIKLREWEDSSYLKIGIYAFQGTYIRKEIGEYTYSYAVSTNMKSSTVWYGGMVPAEPRNVTAKVVNIGEVLLSWTAPWLNMNKVEVSWSKNEHAWESTDDPSTYMLDSASPNMIRIPNLDIGITWYFRVRFIRDLEPTTVYGPYCDPVPVNLTSEPAKPFLTLSDSVISKNKSLKLSWTYDTTDGTKQSFYEVWTANVDDTTGVVTPTTKLYSAYTASTSVTFPKYSDGKTLSTLSFGVLYNLIIRVRSSSGLMSDWSDPAAFVITNPLTCTIAQSSFQTVTITDDDGTTRSVVGLTRMPLTVTVTGATAGGRTTVVIERSSSYQMDRPDESVFNGYENEAVVSYSQDGEGQITITKDMLVGYLDDGAAYRLVATVQDSYGQSASKSKEFIVKWAHQAIMPEATVEYNEDNLVTFITPIAPSGVATGDTCDIYRLSADKPELIISDGVWGTKYVDPYPTIGEYGGHRIVFKTVNGDYITANNHPAWIDLGESDGDYYHVPDVIIDFDGERAMFRYNVTLDNSWKKDFKETKYLGGSVQGDWNAGVSRTGSINSIAVTSMDPDFIRTLRKLAVYPGICHVRTPDGSSYSADVQVSESRDISKAKELVEFTLNITRVDPEGLDGMTYEQWSETFDVELEENEEGSG